LFTKTERSAEFVLTSIRLKFTRTTIRITLWTHHAPHQDEADGIQDRTIPAILKRKQSKSHSSLSTIPQETLAGKKEWGNKRQATQKASPEEDAEISGYF